MITGIDHVVIAVRDLDQAIRNCENLLGRKVDARHDGDGVAIAVVSTDNAAVELMAPAGDGGLAARLRQRLDEGGEGVKSLVFAVRDIAAMHRRAERVGLSPEQILDRGAYRSFRADTARTHGVRLFFIDRQAQPAPAPDGSVIGLDHIVIRSADMERAAALYGARLGLDMRLDRDVAGRRLMFFRCGDAVVEVAADETQTASDTIWGLSWRVADADAARTRLEAAGFDVSPVRAGMKPGTRVFTVRNGTNGVPTLMIEAGRLRQD